MHSPVLSSGAMARTRSAGECWVCAGCGPGVPLGWDVCFCLQAASKAAWSPSFRRVTLFYFVFPPLNLSKSLQEFLVLTSAWDSSHWGHFTVDAAFVLQLPSSPLVWLGAACSPAYNSWTSTGHGECTPCGAWSFPFLSTRSACKECSKPEGYKRKRPVGRSETGKGKHLVSLEKKHVKYSICSFRRRLWDFWPVYVLCFSGIVQ